MVTIDLDSQKRMIVLRSGGLLPTQPNSWMSQIALSASILAKADCVDVNILTAENVLHVGQHPDNLDNPYTIPTKISACSIVVETGKPLVLNDIMKNQHCAVQPWASYIRSYLGAPIWYKGFTVGAICAYTYYRKNWSLGERLALDGLALLVSESLPLDIT